MTKAEQLAAARRIEREAETTLRGHVSLCGYCDVTERGSILTHESCDTGNTLEQVLVVATRNALRAWKLAEGERVRATNGARA